MTLVSFPSCCKYCGPPAATHHSPAGGLCSAPTGGCDVVCCVLGWCDTVIDRRGAGSLFSLIRPRPSITLMFVQSLLTPAINLI